MKKFKIVVLTLLFLATREIAYAQQKALSQSIEDLAGLMAEHPRPIILYIYTDWCSYCKIQDEQITKNVNLQNLINANFYFIRFNAENKSDVLWNGKTYHFKPHGISGGTHEIAFLGQQAKEQLTFPLWLIFNHEYQLLYRQGGFINSDELNSLLNYLIKNHHMTADYPRINP